MIRWYQRPRPLATVPVLLLRAVCGLTIMGLYIAIRLPHLVSPVELVVTWTGAALVGCIVLVAIERLIVQHRDTLPTSEPSPLELTDVFEVPLGWPGAVENQIAEARHVAFVEQGKLTSHLFTHDVLCEPTPPRGTSMPTLTPDVPRWTGGKITEVNSGEVVVEQPNGKPARISLQPPPKLTAEQARELRARFVAAYGKSVEQLSTDRIPAAELIARLRAERPSPTGRHVVSHAPVQIARDRFGQLFGGL